MKVSNAIEILTKYHNADDDIIISWWDKEGGDFYANKTLTNEQWLSVVEIVENEESLFEGVSNAVLDEVQAIVNQEEN